jgi:hypothetical protein
MPATYRRALLALRPSRKLASYGARPIDCSPQSFRLAVAGPSNLRRYGHVRSRRAAARPWPEGRSAASQHQLRAAAVGSFARPFIQIDVVNRDLYQFAQRDQRRAPGALIARPCTARLAGLCPNPHTGTEKASVCRFSNRQVKSVSFQCSGRLGANK